MTPELHKIGRWYPGKTWWVRSAVLSYAGSVVGIVAAAGLSSRVSVATGGAAGAGAVLAFCHCLALALIFVAARNPERLWTMPAALFVAAPALTLAGVVIAAHVVPRFDVDGIWGYVLLLGATYGASEAIGWLANLVRPTGENA